MKSYYEAHKAEIKAAKKAYYQSHKDELKAYKKAWYEANREQVIAQKKAYNQAHKEEIKAYRQANVNAAGETKHSIRIKSRTILKQMNMNIPGYQIHHCFGYEDPSKFIYCSKALHLKIHAYLREHNISADKDHWMAIRDLVNSTDEFVYIKA